MDQSIDRLIERSKHKLMSWENKFATKHGYAATKDDVQKYPAVSLEYKKYAGLKNDRERGITKTLCLKAKVPTIMSLDAIISPRKSIHEKLATPQRVALATIPHTPTEHTQLDENDDSIGPTPIKHQTNKSRIRENLTARELPPDIFAASLRKQAPVEEPDDYACMIDEINNEDFRTLLPSLNLLGNHSEAKLKQGDQTMTAHARPVIKYAPKLQRDPTNLIIKPKQRAIKHIQPIIDFRSVLGEEEMKELDALANADLLKLPKYDDIGVEVAKMPVHGAYNATKGIKKLMRYQQKEKLAQIHKPEDAVSVVADEIMKSVEKEVDNAGCVDKTTNDLVIDIADPKRITNSKLAAKSMKPTKRKSAALDTDNILEESTRPQRLAKKSRAVVDSDDAGSYSIHDDSPVKKAVAKVTARPKKQVIAPKDPKKRPAKVPMLATAEPAGLVTTNTAKFSKKDATSSKTDALVAKLKNVKDAYPKAVNGNFVSMNLRNGGGKGRSANVAGGKGGKFSKFRSQNQLNSFTQSYTAGDDDERNDALGDEELPVAFKRVQIIPNNELTFIKPACDIDTSEELMATISSEHFEFNGSVDIKDALHTLFEFDDFRIGQLETVTRLLQRKSTFALLPTGSGKSLCYQLPSFILHACAERSNTTNSSEIFGVTLIISPTIALMLDQLHNTPPGLRAAALCGAASPGKTVQHHLEVFEKLENNQLDVLFVSPERLLSPQFIKFVSQKRMPKIWLACIDEAHCLSEWSHNFRPSYLHVARVLEEMDVGCVLAMTGTATMAVQSNVCEMLGLSESDIISSDVVRTNLKLKAVKLKDDREKDTYLIDLFSTEPFKTMSSVIIYTTFQATADKLSAALRINNIQAESYHAGKENRERQHIQKKFMSGRIRILVATIAFGLGMDKKDIRSVIHYNLPSSLENYVQEVGRSGRDGNDAHCRLLLCTSDYLMLRKFAYSEGMERSTLRKFILRVFSGAEMAQGRSNSALLFNIGHMEKEYDLKQTVIATILNYLEIETDGMLRVSQDVFMSYKVHFTKTPFETLLDQNEWLAVFKTHGTAERGLSKVLANTEYAPHEFVKMLTDLRVAKEIQYEGVDKGFCVNLNGVDGTLLARADELTIAIHEKIRSLETSKVAKIDREYKIFNAIVEQQLENEQESTEIHNQIGEYFSSSEVLKKTDYSDADVVEKFNNSYIHICHTLTSRTQEAMIDVSLFVQENAELITNGRIVARIFHGISSPMFPAYEWSKHKYWQRFPFVDFGAIVKWANKAIIKYRKD